MYSNTFVCLMGLGIVFFGLICLIALTMAMGCICGRMEKAVSNSAADAEGKNVFEDPQMVMAVITAVLAEELGTEASAVRILSLEKEDQESRCA